MSDNCAQLSSEALNCELTPIDSQNINYLFKIFSTIIGATIDVTNGIVTDIMSLTVSFRRLYT